MSRSSRSRYVRAAALAAPVLASIATAAANPLLEPGSGGGAASEATPPGAMADTGAHTPSVVAQRTERLPWIGAMADLGVPDGATLSIAIRPIRSIRVHGGLSHNLISLGERVGITWVPLPWWASPTLSLEYGHYADGNANPLARAVTGDASFSSAVLERVGYDYANARVGLELGRKWFTFYLHAGMSRITGTVHNLTAETMSDAAGTTSVTFAKDPNIQLWSVSARLGFIVYLAK